MPRWLKENTDPRRDLLGFPVTQTCVMDSSKATLIGGASEQEELEEQLLRAERNLKRFYEAHPVREIHPPGEKLPRGAILKTDWDEGKRALVYIGYKLEEGGDLIRFLKPIPCLPSK
jgi:hypothetical protein